MAWAARRTDGRQPGGHARWSSTTRVLYADLRDPLALLRGDARRAGAVALLGLCRAATPGALPARAGRRLLGADVGLAAAGRGGGARRLPAARPPLPARRRRRRGRFLVAAAARTPELQLMLFDLPAVAGAARARLRSVGLADRAPGLRRRFHARSAAARAPTWSRWCGCCTTTTTSARWPSCARVRRALPPGGTLLVAEPMAGAPGAPRMGDAYFGFYLLAMGAAAAHAGRELAALLHAAGFAQVALNCPRRSRCRRACWWRRRASDDRRIAHIKCKHSLTLCLVRLR